MQSALAHLRGNNHLLHLNRRTHSSRIFSRAQPPQPRQPGVTVVQKNKLTDSDG